MIKKIIPIVLIVLLIADIGYSFLQYYNTPLDGDMAAGILPANDVKPILDNPFGFRVLNEQTRYPNPNRFFCHWSFYVYFNKVPLLLQSFTNPINSAYLACAIAKTLIHATILIFVSLIISGKVFKLDFILAASLITPLFQTNGYQGLIGIIDPSTTYTFFYALPTILLFIYFTPLILKYLFGKEYKVMRHLKYFWIPLALISSLSGPLNPGISLVFSMLLLSNSMFNNFNTSTEGIWLTRVKHSIKNTPEDYFFYSIPISIFSLYSLYLGKFNSIDLSHEISVWILYTRLPQGIFNIITMKLAFPALLSILLINTLIIRIKLPTDEGKRILTVFKWIGIFSLVYILLLPLGGYRDYRPNVLRYDTIIPITLSLIYVFGKTTVFIINNVTSKYKYWYLPLISLVVLIYANSDKLELKNKCEKEAIFQIANSQEEIVRIENKCNVLSWNVLEKPQDSKLNIELLKRWKVIDNDKLYYYKPSGVKDVYAK